MNFELTDQQRMIRDLAREFARREIAPVAAKLDRQQAFPHAIFDKAREIGLLNLTVPETFGGAALGVLDLCLAAEEMAWACTGVTLALELNSIVGDVFAVGGNDAQRKEYLGRLVDGEIGCYAVTEPAAGSDVAAIQTTARRRRDRYVLNGTKIWISNATVATFGIVFAKTDPEAGRDGISALVVEMNSPGVTISRKLEKLGQRSAPAAEINLVDVEVPLSSRVGKEGAAFLIAMHVFDRSRPMIAAMATGLTQRCLDESLSYATMRQTMGRPIIRHQAIGHRIADMAMRGEASRQLTRQAAWMLDQGQRNTRHAAYAKAFAADTATWAASEAVQVHGGMGYSTEMPVEKLYRDAKVLQIYEGTSEIQRNVIVRELSN